MSETLQELCGVEKDRTGYVGFPHYEQEDFSAPYTVEVYFPTIEDAQEFSILAGYHTLTHGKFRSLKSYWYPPLQYGERGGTYEYCWVEED